MVSMNVQHYWYCGFHKSDKSQV